MKVVTVSEMRAAEEATFEAGTPEDALQRRAATAVAHAISAHTQKPGIATSLVGAGNNGRDACLALELLQARGWKAFAYLTPRHSILPGELARLAANGGAILPYADDQGEGLRALLEHADVVIDGLLGIGARGAPRSPLDEIIRSLNDVRDKRGVYVVAVDLPSGVDPETGEVAGDAVNADLTVVLGGAKRGLLTARAATRTGHLCFADIGIIGEPEHAAELVTRETVLGTLALPAPDSHKGSFGRLLVVAGSARYLGAAALVCAAAMRAGAGIVTLAAPAWLRDVVASRLPEATYLLLPDEGPAGEPVQSAARVSERLGDYTALAIGPGLSTEGGVPQFVEQVLKARARSGVPAVIDADGLNCLARFGNWSQWIGENVVLTPHLGELRRLAPDMTEDTSAPWEIARDRATKWGVTLVVKGPFTGIGSGGKAWVHARPNPALATAGTGDVLTGTIGGLLARGTATADAARLGVWTHAEAGARAGDGLDAGGMLATDLLCHIPRALAAVVRREDESR